jgi:hypothetical protein
VREQVRTVVRRRLVERFALTGADAALRAEILIALVLGISLTRANGTLPELAGASREQIDAALKPIVDALA